MTPSSGGYEAWARVATVIAAAGRGSRSRQPVDAVMARSSGVVQADKVITNAVVSASYTPPGQLVAGVYWGMDGQDEPEKARDAGRSATLAVAIVGAGQLLAWSVIIGYLFSATDAVDAIDALEALAVGAVVLAAWLGGVWTAAHVIGRRRPWATAWLSILAVAAALLVAFFVTFLAYGLFELFSTGGSWRPPAVGAAMGAQLAVLLPGSSLRLAVRRFGTPVLVDIIAAVVAEPFEAQTGWGALGLAIGWFILALATVAWMERASLARETGSPPTEQDEDAFV
jgi:hypothetical protein